MIMNIVLSGILGIVMFATGLWPIGAILIGYSIYTLVKALKKKEKGE